MIAEFEHCVEIKGFLGDGWLLIPPKGGDVSSSPPKGDGWLRFTSPPSLFLILTQSLYNQSLCDWLGFFNTRMLTSIFAMLIYV